MSSNIQKIIEHAKDPSCVMCASPMFGGAWHSTIRAQYQPRNFVSTKYIYWVDFETFFKAIGTNDFYFRIKFRINSYTQNAYIFQNSSSASIYLGCWSGNVTTPHLTSSIKITTNAIGNLLIPAGADNFFEEHTLEIERRNGTANVIFDGVIKSSATNQTNIDCSTLDDTAYPFYTRYDVSFSEIYIEDLDAGTSWSAPHDVLWQENPQPVLPPVAGDSIAQRLGLLTKYNCDTSQLDFRLASTSINNWYVKTGLNFAGWSRPLTIIGRMYIAPDDGGTSTSDYDNNTVHMLMSQGQSSYANPTSYCIALCYNNYNNSNTYRLYMSDGVTHRAYLISPASNPRGTTVTLGITFDPTIGTIKFYENGVLLYLTNATALMGFVINPSPPVADANAVIVSMAAYLINRNDRADWCMVYDRVLSDAKIKYLST